MTTLEINPDIDPCELGRLFGGRNSVGFSSRVSLKIEQMGRIFRKHLRPRLHYRKIRVRAIRGDSVHLEKGVVFKSRKFPRVFKDCETIVCFIATIGHGIEAEIKKFIDQKRLSAAYILDCMGSVAVESIVEKFHRSMEKEYRAKEQGVTLRFSPGYCDWPIADQKKLFSIFDSQRLGVDLNDCCLMQPRKSISGAFGLLPSHLSPSSQPRNPCDECAKKGCIARRQ